MNLFYYLRGITAFTVETKKPARLINALRENVAVRNIKPVCDGQIEFVCFYDGTKKARNIIVKEKARIVKEKSCGLIHLFYRYRKRVGLYVTTLVVFAFLMVSQLFVWEIRVEGNEKIMDSEVIAVLEKIGFKEGAYKRGVDIDSLVNNFLILEKRVSWIAVNFDGSVAHVEIREGKNPEIYSKKKNVNLVASHDGIILRADVLEGGSLVAKGDVVHKGQLLVSAFVDRDGKSTLRGARGCVWANTVREITVYVPLKYGEKQYTGKEINRYNVKVLGLKTPVFLPKSKDAIFGAETSQIKGMIDGKYRFPFTVYHNKYRHYITVSKKRTEKQALEKAREKSYELLLKNSPDFKVASKAEEYSAIENVFVYKCVYSGVENIAKQMEFEISE